MHFLRKTKKTQSKTLCSILAASIIFSSIVPTIVFAEEDENIPEPTATPIPEPIETEPQTEYKTVTVKWNANDFDGNSYEGTIPGGFVECAGYSISKAK